MLLLRELHDGARRVAAATYRAFDAQTKVATREITQFATSGKLMPLGQKYIIGELETILQNVSRAAGAQRASRGRRRGY